jgi:imidazolonepropionase-like amidohydrolase
MTPAAVERAKKSLADDGRNMMKLRAAGMKVVMGTDTGQTRHLIGYFNHMVLESYVAIGMTPSEAIVASTKDSAEAAKINTGYVAPGRLADFTVLDANPLENISNTRKINKVYLRGQEVPRAAFAARWQSQFRQTASTTR